MLGGFDLRFLGKILILRVIFLLYFKNIIYVRVFFVGVVKCVLWKEGLVSFFSLGCSYMS